VTGAQASEPVGFDAAAVVVFDCDGVLVDSERLAIRVEAQALAELGWPLSESEVAARFVGRSAAYMHEVVERRLGHAIDWEATFGRRHREAFEGELVAVDGVREVVHALVERGTPICVASSSTHDSIEFKLRRTELWEAFEGHVFSVEDVARAKPAPDVFLHAACTMGAVPARCAVVEDSASGVAAGLAAGMAVYGYAGGVTGADRLAADGVVVFDDMSVLLGLLGHGGAPWPPRS
jgi:HAD superfamily hydrolase (TIGR01509 family)